ncbi:hypothetical protein BDZ94DRAFT_1234674 [Collybia nuda]|uniref:T6SS Phospholipase effector Tle1-like catalytic domain-containing protein n=1 Tax=Collybia nuda TaxID=64659 RepID=A0A9P5Y9P0_9AGAR|nr:hypothetical protein BDZ94DRAFT_1234674 [Collybia nuda]
MLESPSTGCNCAPEVPKARTLVLCFDGTSNEYDGDNTNIVKFLALLKKDDFNEQISYYQVVSSVSPYYINKLTPIIQPGIGTWFNPGVVSPIFQWCAKILDEAFAWYMDAHVIDGYRFLMQNYRAGDKICIFGSYDPRGFPVAHTLHGIIIVFFPNYLNLPTGALYKVGLLPRDNEQQIPFAYKLYKREDQEGIQLCAGYKQTFSQNVKIHFVGVWDTVASVGVVMGRTLPFTNSNKAIKTFRHALALDEHRGRFRPNYYHRPAPDSAAAALDPEQASPILTKDPGSSNSAGSRKQKIISLKRRGLMSKFWKRRTEILVDVPEEEGDPTDVLEVWFAGCHSDVGGGAVSDSVVNSLANISLRWMVHEVVKSQCGILFDELALQRASIFGIFPGTPVEDSPIQQALEEGDALEPVHDPLKQNVLWWILEIIPLFYFWQDEDGAWHREFSFHLGKGREIQDSHPLFHATVKRRMESSLKYSPRALWTKGSEVYVR